MRAHRSRLPLAVLGAVAAAAAATLILRPRSGLIEPAAVEATAYFSPAELDRAEDFRGPQRLLGLAGLGLSGATLVLIALRPPERLRRVLERAGRRPVLGTAAAAAGLSLLLVVVDLPLAAVRHERAVDVGLSTQTWAPWLGDVAKGAGLEAGLAAAGGALGIAVIRRFRRHWWAPAAAVIVAFGVLSMYLFPVVVAPLFNRFEELPPGDLRNDVVQLAQQADVDVGEVYRVDASRRTTGANAYVGGLGNTKRVVLYDTLIERFSPKEVRSVIAHELAHVKNRDVPRGLLWLAIVAPPGMFLVQQLTRRLPGGPLDSGAKPGPEALPALVLSLALVGFVLGAASNNLSRQVEARADAYALELAGDPGAFIGLERKLALTNVSDPDPPALLHGLFGTHPTTVDRIGIGLAWGGRP
jgi:STE24 endopeptidase